jgi:hypothetical protein
MGRRRDAKRLARQIKRDERRMSLRIVVFVAAVIASGLTKNLWAEWFDDLIGLLGDGSTAAAFVGWLAGYGVVIYGLIVLASSRRWPDAFKRTWLLGVLLLIPCLTLQPSRYTRSATIQDEYWYLGSFFDTYGLVLATVLAAAAAGGLCLWQATRNNSTDVERSGRWMKAATWVAVTVLGAGTLGTLVWAFVGF